MEVVTVSTAALFAPPDPSVVEPPPFDPGSEDAGILGPDASGLPEPEEQAETHPASAIGTASSVASERRSESEYERTTPSFMAVDLLIAARASRGSLA
jgi:hypothetical protein